ncbi:MAG: hypothetical protein ABSF87_13700 [Xanthobacteraceae bacterium]
MAENDLLIENQTLRARVAELEAEVSNKQLEAAMLRRAAKRQKELDPNATDMFRRPYRGG